MSYQGVVEQLRKIAVELEGNPAIQVTTCKFNPPATSMELNVAIEGFQLTPAMIDFYSQANGVEIAWEMKHCKELSDGGLAAGVINLLPIQKVFSDWNKIIYFHEKDPFKPLHPLDFFIEEACAALYLDGSVDPEVYYHYCGEEMSPLGVNFEGYLQLLLKSRGFWYWQKTLAQPQYDNPYVLASVERSSFAKVMVELFPDFSLSDFDV